jgi:transposase
LARRTFDVTDVTEILVHWYAGRSQSEIATSLGVDRKTIRKYLAPAIAAGIAPGGPPVTTAEWTDLVSGWFPALADTRLRQTTWPEIERRRDYIAEMLKLGVTQATIHQRLRDEQGLQASVASLKRWVAANLPDEVRRDQVTVLGEEAEPGAEAQIDYGHLGSWVDPRSGRKQRVWAFVMVLACSRLMFVRPVLRMDQRAWTEAHVEAFAFFDGVPARLVPDNLKTGVDKPDLYDPKINRSYAELAEHYGTLIDPARAAKPKDKPRVERPMPYVRDSFWRGREFVSLQHMQEQALLYGIRSTPTMLMYRMCGCPVAVLASIRVRAPTRSSFGLARLLAQCTTAPTPSSAARMPSGSVWSPLIQVTAGGAFAGRGRRLSRRTGIPAAVRWRTTRRPSVPRPPVTSTSSLPLSMLFPLRAVKGRNR